MTHFIVHVGPHKTGTTYLQECFAQLRPQLAERGILFPTFWGPTAHHALYERLRTVPNPRLEDDFAQIRAVKPDQVLISVEGLAGLPEQSVEYLHRLVGEGNTLECIYYARAWADVLPSHWKEEVKGGETDTLPEYLYNRLKNPSASSFINFGTGLRLWAKFFGPSAIRIVAYNHLLSLKLDLFQHFSQTFLRWTEPPKLAISSANVSPGAADIEVARAIAVLERMQAGEPLQRAYTGAMAQRYLRRKDELRTDRIAKALEDFQTNITISELNPFLTELHRNLMTEFGSAIVAPRMHNHFFSPRVAKVPYISPNWLLAPGVQDDLRAIQLAVRTEILSTNALGQQFLPAYVLSLPERGTALQSESPPEPEPEAAAPPPPAAPLPEPQAPAPAPAPDPEPEPAAPVAAAPGSLTMTIAAEKPTTPEQYDEMLRARPGARLGAPVVALQFGRQGNVQVTPRDGWSGPENGFNWSTGGRSTLTLPRPKLEDVRLTLSLRPYTAPQVLTRQRFRMWINDVPVEEIVLQRVSVVECDVPWAVLQRSETLALRFEFPDAARPADLGTGSRDIRVLGGAFQWLRLSPLPAPAAPPVPPAEAAALAELMLRFESLGENCEFGLVQRRCGVDPLGLLRFSSTPLPKLLPALQARFEGMGAPGTLEVEISPNGREYMIYDRSYGFRYHAWVNVGEKPAAEVLTRQYQRVGLLVRKLVEELTDGRKIFVFRGMTPLTVAQAQELADRVHAIGPGTVLWLELADAAHAPGSVIQVAPGLLKGHMDRFAPGDDAKDVSLDCWIRVCRAAAALVA